jgi:hypothetical protein
MVPKRIWSPQVKSIYEEPEDIIDQSENLDFLFGEAGKTVLKHKHSLPPRDDITRWNKDKHEEVFNKNINWSDCPDEHKPVITAILQEYWDVMDPEGALNHVMGYEFQVDTGNHALTCAKTPRYGPHESSVMNKLLTALDKKGVIKPDYGPYGAIIVLAAKPNQGHVHWSEYVFRLCVSY